MSLINDALKKAQKLRTAETGPVVPAASAAGVRVAKRQRPVSVQMMLLGTGVGALIIALVTATIFFFLRQPEVARTPKKEIVKAPATPPPPPTPPVPSVQAPTTPAPTETPALFKLPALATEKPEPAKPAPLATAVAPVEEAPPPPPPPKADPGIVAFINDLKVTGIRSSGADSKVLMNDRVYRLNDMVNVTLGLKLTGVAVNTLTFVDERGFVYTKNF